MIFKCVQYWQINVFACGQCAIGYENVKPFNEWGERNHNIVYLFYDIFSSHILNCVMMVTSVVHGIVYIVTVYQRKGTFIKGDSMGVVKTHHIIFIYVFFFLRRG